MRWAPSSWRRRCCRAHICIGIWSLRGVEAMSLLVVLIAVGQITFGAIAHEDLSLYPLEFVIFPFVMWAAVRFGPPTTAVVILVAATLTILHAVARGAPVAVPGAPAQLVLLQIHMSVLAVSGLMLAAATRERVTAERRRAANHRSARILWFAARRRPFCTRWLSSLHWDVGALWRLDAERGELRCITVVSRPGCEAPVFCADTATRTFAPGRGLPGPRVGGRRRVLDRGCPPRSELSACIGGVFRRVAERVCFSDPPRKRCAGRGRNLPA
jgi:hypothetical protein